MLSRIWWRILKKKKSVPASSYRKFIFSQMVAAFSMLSSWLGVNRNAPFVRKSVSLISESVSWSCQSADSRRLSWFNRSNELLFDVDMSFSHVALASWPLCDIFYRKRDRWDRFRRSKATRYGRSTSRKTRTRRIVGQLRIDTLLLYLIVDLPCPRSTISSSIEMVGWKKKKVRLGWVAKSIRWMIERFFLFFLFSPFFRRDPMKNSRDDRSFACRSFRN